jgi:hypothetical protein
MTGDSSVSAPRSDQRLLTSSTPPGVPHPRDPLLRSSPCQEEDSAFGCRSSPHIRNQIKKGHPVRMAFFNFGAEGGTRTPTGLPTTPSRWRVYQFHHFGKRVNYQIFTLRALTAARAPEGPFPAVLRLRAAQPERARQACLAAAPLRPARCSLWKKSSFYPTGT